LSCQNIADQHDRVPNGNTDHHSQQNQEAVQIEFYQPRRESAIFSAQGRRLKQSASEPKTAIDLPGVAPMLVSASFATAGEKLWRNI